MGCYCKIAADQLIVHAADNPEHYSSDKARYMLAGNSQMEESYKDNCGHIPAVMNTLAAIRLFSADPSELVSLN